MPNGSVVPRNPLPSTASIFAAAIIAGVGASHIFKACRSSKKSEKRRPQSSVHDIPVNAPWLSDETSSLVSQLRIDTAVLQESTADDNDLCVLIDALPALVWRASADGTQDYANRRFLEYLGRPLDLSVGNGWVQFLHPDDVESTLQTWVSALESGSSYRHPYRFRGADGVYRWFESVAEPLRDEHGHVVRWYGVLFEFDDQRQAEEALRSTRASLNRATQVATVAEISASIAHEINQPLAAILANSEACRSWLSKSPPGIDRALLTAERLVRDGKAAAEVVLRIRRLFQQAEPHKESLDLNGLVREVLTLMNGDITKHKVSVLTELDANIPATLADRTQMQQVITNIIGNAIDSMDEEGGAKLLTIRSRSTEEMVHVDVRDSGSGSPDLSMMFEPFFTTKNEGMGMGLAICKAIVDSHGGQLSAEHNADSGLTVSLSLSAVLEGQV